MIENNILDLVHDYIVIDGDTLKEIKNDFVATELSRLSLISHLGLIGYTRRLAKHTKLDHAYGTYWLCHQCEQYAKGLVSNRKAFLLAGLLHGIGHLPFAFDSEYALVKLYYINSPTRDWLNEVFKICLNFVENDALEIIVQEMKTRLDYANLYRWFTVYKLATSEIFKNELGKQIAGIILMPNLIENQLLRDLDELDCTLRDMHYLGLGRIELNLAPLLMQFQKDASGKLITPKFFNFISSARECLKEQVYFGQDEKCLAALWERELVSYVIDNKYETSNLLTSSDVELETLLKGKISISESINKIKQKKIFQVGNYSCDFQNKSATSVEAKLAGTNLKGIYNSHQKTGVYVQCFPQAEAKQSDNVIDRAIYPGVVHLTVDSDLAKPVNVINTLIDIELSFPEARDSSEASCRLDAMKYIIGMDVKPDFIRYKKDLENILDKIIPHLDIETEDIKPDMFVDSWYLKNWAIMEYIFYREDEDWMSMHFLQYPEHWSTDIVNKVLSQVRLPKLRPRKGESPEQYKSRKERMLEYQTYLERLLSLRLNNAKGWVLPSVKLTDGKYIYEIDAISLYTPNNNSGKINLDLFEVSYNQAPEKEQESRAKLLKISQQIKYRFNSKIIIKNYFNQKELI